MNLSSEKLVSKFAFKCNLHRYSAGRTPPALAPLLCVATDASGRRIAAAGHPLPAPVPFAGFGGGGGLGRLGGLGGLGGGGGLLGAKKTDRPVGIHLWEASP